MLFFAQELSFSYIHSTDTDLIPLPGVFIQLQMLKSLPTFGLDSCPKEVCAVFAHTDLSLSTALYCVDFGR